MVSSIGFSNYPSGNVYAQLRNRYGVAPDDFGMRPYSYAYPAALPPIPAAQKGKSPIARILQQCYA